MRRGNMDRMVMPGQFLERPAIISVRDELALEGLYHRGDETPGLLVCPAVDPVGNAGLHAAVVAELAFACARNGRPSLRFSHRGIGASLGEKDPSAALEDAEAAYNHLSETVGLDISVAGYLSGSETAVRLARKVQPIRHLILVAPTTAIELEGLESQVFVILPESASALVADHYRRHFERRPENLQIVADADERFIRGLEDVSRRVSEWLAGGERSERRASTMIEEVALRVLGRT